MSGFVCLYGLHGAPVGETEHASYVVAGVDGVPEPLCWRRFGSFAAGISTAGAVTLPAIARRGALVGVGTVRLDDRPHVARLAGVAEADASDLDLALALYERQGDHCAVSLLGDFALVIWDAARGALFAARDAFGVKALFYAERPGLLVLSSRAATLAGAQTSYDLDYVAAFLAAGHDQSGRTVFEGVRQLPAASTLFCGRERATTRAYWKPEDVEVDRRAAHADPHELCGHFRALLTSAVAARMGDRHDVWAQLSGGLDSSSVTSVAQTLARRDVHIAGLAGTVTVVDSLGTGDERRFSDVVVQRYGLRNETVHDYWAWQDDGLAPPRRDEPHPFFPFFARDRRIWSVVRSAGSTVLLSGFGSDHYLAGNLYFFADALAAGRLLATAREMLRWSVTGQRSFWRFAFENGVRPLLPGHVRRALRRRDRAPGWVDARFSRRFGVEELMPAERTLAAPPGRKYAGEVAYQLRSLSAFVERGLFEEQLEVRYPFLHRPLVEFALRLPHEWKTRPYARKWVLRESMKGILPERVRTRVGKGGIDARIVWSVRHERQRLDAMLRDPILGQLGCVDPTALRRATEDASAGRITNAGPLFTALALETWLYERSGRWTVHQRAAS